MDLKIAHRLGDDEVFKKKLLTHAQEFVKTGQDAAQYWAGEWDSAHDILMCYAPLTKQEFEDLEKGHPKRFMLPVAATQITTMATFIAQTLFGDQSPHKVEGRGGEDQVPAEMMNQLLRWNDDQHPMYALGYQWVQDALVFNRGVFHTSWAPLYKTRFEPSLVADPYADPEKQLRDPETGQYIQATYMKPKRVRTKIGGYCRLDLVNPYDFFCDPILPLLRFQDSRFAGHDMDIPWLELKRRSELEIGDPDYVLPDAVEKLKNAARKPIVPGGTKARVTGGKEMLSRTTYERASGANGVAKDKAGKSDHGIVRTTTLYERLIPKELEIDDEKEACLYQFLIGNGDVLLAVNQVTYNHDMFPYNIGEPRVGGHRQFSPSWMMLLAPMQRMIDYLRGRHQDALSRTVGNIFIARSDKVDLKDFLNPDKEGLIIPILPDAGDMPLDQIVKQVQINDLTANFPKEMAALVQFSETVTGANNYMQGQSDGNDDTSATQFIGVQQMAAGRMASVARLLSTQALVPQTKQITMNFQQFMDEPMEIRIVGDSLLNSAALRGAKSVTINASDIQAEFDFMPHDGALPGTNAQKVAALSRIIEAAGMFPQLFEPKVGNFNLKLLFAESARAADVPIENYEYKEGDPDIADAQAAAQAQQAAGPMMAAPGAPGQPSAPPPAAAGPPPPGTQLPPLSPEMLDASSPQGPSPAPGGSATSLPPLSLPSAEPTQPHP